MTTEELIKLGNQMGWHELIKEASYKMRMMQSVPDRIINVIGDEEE